MVSLLAIAGLGMLCGCELHQPAPFETDRPLPLTVEEFQILPSQTHRFRIELAKVEFLEVQVEQLAADLRVAVLDPADRQLLEVDGPYGERGLETVQLVAGAPGRHSILIHAGARRGGSYRIHLRARRPATEEDRIRAAAARHYHRGEQWRRSAKAERDRALEDYRRAAASWASVGDREGERLAWHRMGQVHRQLGDQQAALEAYWRAVRLAEDEGAKMPLADLLFGVAKIQFDAARYQEALRCFERAALLYESLGDGLRRARTLSRIAWAHERRGELGTARRLFRRALEIGRQQGDLIWQGTVLTSLGETELRLGQPELARDRFRQALELRRQSADDRGRAITLTSLGTAHRRLGELEDARRCFLAAWPIQHRLGDRAKAANTLVGLGLTELDLGRWARAERALRSAAQIAREAGSRRTEAVAWLDLAEVYEKRGEPALALPFTERSLSILRQLQDRQGEASACFVRARIERALGRLESARRWLELAIEGMESVRARAEVDDLRTSYFAFKRRYYEDYIDLLMELDRTDPGRGLDILTLEASERSRARSLVETLSLSRAELVGARPAAAALLQQERQLREQMIARELERARWVVGDPPAAEVERVEGELRRLASDYHEVRSQIRRSDPGGAVLTRLPIPEIDELRHRILDQDTALLEISLGEVHSYLWWVDQDTVETHRLPGRARIAGLARQFHQTLAESHKESAGIQARLLGRDLGRLILGPVAARLGDRRLVIVADGPLQYVPFAALVDPRTAGSDPAPLVARHEVVGLPSLGVLELLRREQRRVLKTLAVVADPVFEHTDPRIEGRPADAMSSVGEAGNGWEELRRLPFAAAEAAAILDLVEPDQRLAALGFEADLDLVRSGALAGFRILHFATHGLLHAEHPELSGLVLSRFDELGRERPGILYAHEIYDLELAAELVVLSACRTALGREVRGEGLIGLTRGFLQAGASRVVVSLWNVDDEATTELMQRFYRGLLVDGLAPAAALRAAQLGMLGEERWRAPYYWAGFVVQGNWR